MFWANLIMNHPFFKFLKFFNFKLIWQNQTINLQDFSGLCQVFKDSKPIRWDNDPSQLRFNVPIFMTQSVIASQPNKIGYWLD